MEELTINVKGMVCKGCENRIKNALVSIGGIKNVEANYHTGLVKIQADETVKQETVEETITNIGFEVVK